MAELTPEILKTKRYNVWGGNPNGVPYDPSRCAETVWDNHLSHQCRRKNGHGHMGLYCKQHDPEFVKERDEERRQRADREWQERRKQIHGKTFYDALKTIADGHNDARGFAENVLKNFHDGGLE